MGNALLVALRDGRLARSDRPNEHDQRSDHDAPDRSDADRRRGEGLSLYAANAVARRRSSKPREPSGRVTKERERKPVGKRARQQSRSRGSTTCVRSKRPRRRAVSTTRGCRAEHPSSRAARCSIPTPLPWKSTTRAGRWRPTPWSAARTAAGSRCSHQASPPHEHKSQHECRSRSPSAPRERAAVDLAHDRRGGEISGDPPVLGAGRRLAQVARSRRPRAPPLTDVLPAHARRVPHARGRACR